MAKSLTSKVARAQPTVLAIYRKVFGADADASVVLGDLEDGVEQLLELVEAAFELDGSWTGDGSAMNGTLDAFIRQVAQHWDGVSLDESWTKPLQAGPLLRAAQEKKWALAMLLVAQGAALDEPDARGWTALHHAAKHSQRALVQALLDAGANVELESTKSYSEQGDGLVPKGTPAWAIRGGCMDLLNPVGPVQRDGRGNTLLHLVAAEKSVSVDPRLVDKCVRQMKIDVNAVNAFGWTALHYACWHIANCALIVQLIALGADPRRRTTKRHKTIAAGVDAHAQLAQGGYDKKGIYYWATNQPNPEPDPAKPWRNTIQRYFMATADELLTAMPHSEFATSQHPSDLRR
jgi:hypothetical protein